MANFRRTQEGQVYDLNLALPVSLKSDTVAMESSLNNKCLVEVIILKSLFVSLRTLWEKT